MILGIGIDIVKIVRIKNLVEKYGDRFLRKILSNAELETIAKKRIDEFAAGRFAAKEALYKALGKNYNLSFSDISVLGDNDNKPYIHIPSELKEKAWPEDGKHIVIHVSISHDTDYATALVIIESI